MGAVGVFFTRVVTTDGGFGIPRGGDKSSSSSSSSLSPSQ